MICASSEYGIYQQLSRSMQRSVEFLLFLVGFGDTKTTKKMRDYIQYYVRTRGLSIQSELPQLLAQAKADPLGEEAGLTNLATRLGIPPVPYNCCVSCGLVIADFGFKGEIAKWCTMHKPEGTVLRVPNWLKRERPQSSIDHAREMRAEMRD